MLLLVSLFLFSQNPTNPPTATPAPATTQPSAVSPTVKAALENQRIALENKMVKGDLEVSKDVVKWNTFAWTFLGLVSFSLATLVGSVLWSTKRAHTLIEDRLKQKLKEKTDKWWEVLGDYENDQTLKTETRVHVLTKNGDYQTRMLLDKWGFQKVSVGDAGTFVAKPNEYDLLLFHKLSSDLINQIMAALPDQVCVAYAPNVHLKLDHQDRINLANSPITLFTRTLEAARFQRTCKG